MEIEFKSKGVMCWTSGYFVFNRDNTVVLTPLLTLHAQSDSTNQPIRIMLTL
jgi:hypothetical protein